LLAPRVVRSIATSRFKYLGVELTGNNADPNAVMTLFA
jgi:hypothetical protein